MCKEYFLETLCENTLGRFHRASVIFAKRSLVIASNFVMFKDTIVIGSSLNLCSFTIDVL